MLLAQSQFLLKQGIRTPLQLMSPPVVERDQVQPPRETVFHYLDIDSDVRMPVRSLTFLGNLPRNKRIPLTNVVDAESQLEVVSVHNRNPQQEILKWREDNTKNFRLVDLFTEPNTDIEVNSIVNYNLLKDRYKLKTSVTSHISWHTNVFSTYWASVVKMCKAAPSSNQFVQLTIPSLIPSPAAIQTLLKQKSSTYARVVTNPHLNNILQLFMYLSEATRSRSLMSVIPVEVTPQITMEMTYKGHSCFFKLSDLVGLSEENELPLKTKYNVDKVQRFFIVALLKIQTAVVAKLEAADPGEMTLTDQTNVDFPQVPETDDFEEDPESSVNPNQEDRKPDYAIQTAVKKSVAQTPPKQLTPPELDKFDDVPEMSLDSMIETSAAEISGVTDDLFIKSIQAAEAQVTEETTDSPDAQSHFHVNYDDHHLQAVLKDSTPEDVYTEIITEAQMSGGVATSEIRALKKLVTTRKELKSPYGDQLLDIDKIVPPELEIPPPEASEIKMDNNLVPDYWKHETLMSHDKHYVDKVYRKDVLAAVSHLEKAGVIIKGYEVDRVGTSSGKYDVHKLTLKPLRGKESTVYFRLPTINDEGEMIVSGIKLRMRRQRTEVPIRKIGPARVALTTAYGKLFVERTERRAYDKYAQITTRIKDDYLQQTGKIKRILPGNVYNNLSHVPNAYAMMSRDFKEVSTDEYTFSFDESVAKDHLDKDTYITVHGYSRSEPEKRMTYCGFRKDKRILVMDINSDIHLYSKGGNHEHLGSLEDLLGYAGESFPSNFSTIKILGDAIPLGVVLAYHIGLQNLLAVTKTKFTVLEARKQYQPTKNEIVLRFDNAKLVVVTDTEEKRLLFSGFLFYKDITKSYPIESFGLKEVYLELLEHRNCGVIHLKEMDLLRQLFIDPIAAADLKGMNEPHEYLKLLLRANNMLETFRHEDPNDPHAGNKIRGYDRVPSLMYRVLAESVRKHKLTGNGKGKIELDPYAVWNAVTRDTTVKITEESNPVIDLKEVESVTFSGADGLNKSATPEYLRRYHKSDAGLVSEATVDSSDVGLNFFLTPYAKISNIRGKIDPGNQLHEEHPELKFSTSTLLAPMAERDDPKRV